MIAPSSNSTRSFWIEEARLSYTIVFLAGPAFCLYGGGSHDCLASAEPSLSSPPGDHKQSTQFRKIVMG